MTRDDTIVVTVCITHMPDTIRITIELDGATVDCCERLKARTAELLPVRKVVTS